MNPPASRPPAARPASASTYTIQAGDTFSSIAQKLYGSERRWVDIAQANPTIDPARLRVGQVIRLPGAAAGASAASAQPAAQTPRLASAASAGQGRSYTVQPRDTLSSIARRFYGDSSKWYIIYQANRARIGSNPDRMPAGISLVIPPASQATR
ncbi:MAG TPA: LysM peptidoglycan-binding domain-containing protein [Phycisphaeraceae bacterium]